MGRFEVVDSLKSLVSGLGTAKDKTRSLQHYFCALSPVQLMTMYRSDWLARKVVDIIPNDMTREWRNWQAKGPQIEKIEAVEKAPLINLQVKVNQAMQTGRLLGGAVLYIGIRGADPAEELDPRSVGQGDLQYLHVLSRYALSGRDLIQDVTSEFYGQPAYYEISGTNGRQVKVHPSRVVPFYGAPVLERRFAQTADYWSDSVLQVVHDAVLNATSSQQHIAALLPEAKTDVIYIPGLSGYAATADGRAKLTSRFGFANEVKSIFNALLLDGTGQVGTGAGGEKWEQKQISFAQLPELMRQFLQVAAAAADVPATRLLGESPGGLNATGESDLRNYYDNISARQQTELSPALHRLDEIVIRSALGARPRGIYYEWASLWTPSESERAEAFKNKATAIRSLAGGNGQLPIIPLNALSDAAVNMLVEDGSMPGLEAAIAEHGRLADQPPPADETGSKPPPKEAKEEENQSEEG